MILCAVSFAIANVGLSNIITFAVPVLMFLYPLAIILILLGLAAPLFKSKQSVFAAAMFFTFFVSIIDGYNALIESVPVFELGFLNTIAEFYKSFYRCMTSGSDGSFRRLLVQ